jgi:hypothetical protein
MDQIPTWASHLHTFSWGMFWGGVLTLYILKRKRIRSKQ